MIKSDKAYKVCIDITTFKTKPRKGNKQNNMTTIFSNKKNNPCQNKFICSICLNQNSVDENTGTDFNKRKSKSCPICHGCDFSEDCDSTVTRKSVQKSNGNKIEGSNMKLTAKDIQTSEPDVTQGLTLLNEVLSVFQTKKQIGNRRYSGKTIIYKDIGVSTDDVASINRKPKLTLNKLYQFSINDKESLNDNKFTIVSSCQPEILGSHNSVDLIKHKSSSIPQMKLEELKNSLKEKTKSKDAVEEVQRMFATVKKIEPKNSLLDINRPMIRNGPRVLPVVKTPNYEVQPVNDKLAATEQNTFKCCHGNNYYLSSGDSSGKQKCRHSANKCVERCDDCVYMLCCHYKENQNEVDELICKRCRTKNGYDCRHRGSKNSENA